MWPAVPGFHLHGVPGHQQLPTVNKKNQARVEEAISFLKYRPMSARKRLASGKIMQSGLSYPVIRDLLFILCDRTHPWVGTLAKPATGSGFSHHQWI